jgi:uncharacterized protein YkwD
MRKKQLIYSTLYNLIILILGMGLVGARAPGVTKEEISVYMKNQREARLPLSNFLIFNYTGCGDAYAPAVNEAYEQQVVDLVNEIRENHTPPLPALVVSDELTDAARYHATDMAIDGYFKHDTFDPGNPDPVCLWHERISTFYSGWNALGENIARGQATPQQVVNAWMNSDGHAQNILNEDYTEIGVGYYKQDGTSPYWVQDFGRRNAVLGNLPTEISFVYSISQEQIFPDQYRLTPDNVVNPTGLIWMLSTNQSWIDFNPGNGSSPESFTVSANGFSSDSEAVYSGSLLVTVTDPGDTVGSPHTINVRLTIIADPITSIFLPVVGK